MFEETIRALHQLEGQTTVSVPIGDDEEGFFDRECPSEECLFQFKVRSDDWKEKVRNEEVFCPNCAHTADSGQWWTQEQLAHARQAAITQISERIGLALEQDAIGWNARQRPNGFISMTMSVDSRRQHVPLPPAATEPMKLKITCPICVCCYAVIGAAYFCPACGHNAADQLFSQTANGVGRALDQLDAVRAAIADRDIGEYTVRLLIENGLQNTVTAFQRCAESLFVGLPSSPKFRKNAFQNLAEGDELWRSATGKGFSDHLSIEQLDRLKIAFQQRHLLAHTQGIVDDGYVLKSGDSRYRAGQRLVVSTESVRDTLDLITKLIGGLQSDSQRYT